MDQELSAEEAIYLFSEYMRLTGTAHTGPEKHGDPLLIGKRLGLVNGGNWISLWSTFFGRKYLPGVHLVAVGNEAVQVNFMQAHENHQPVPPQSNVDAFVRYALDLVQLAQVDAVLITCSTMNRAYPQVQKALAPYGCPVVQIDRPMMERAVEHGGHVCVVATHGPTVNSTQALLRETAQESGIEITYTGVDCSEAWYRLAAGDVAGHNLTIAEAIREKMRQEAISSVVLAQLSMSVFLLSYPDPLTEFGVPVLTSGQCGFEAVRAILTSDH